MLMKTSTQSLTEQLSERFAERIRNRLLAPGARLPSVRQCAQQNGVSPSTVVAAYDQLLAQGLVEARKNRGFFVRENSRRGHAPPGPAHPDPRKRTRWPTGAPPTGLRRAARARGSGRVARQRHGADPRHVPQDQRQAAARHGRVSAEWLESTFMPAAVRKVTNSRSLQDFSLQYGEPLGDAHLRRLLAKKLATLNVHTVPEHIITTVGATHALDIVSRTLLRPATR
jgi:DNA-binding transcriptional MocR family regulator